MRQLLRKLSREPSLEDFAADIAGSFGDGLADPDAYFDPDSQTLALLDGATELARITLPNMYGAYRDASRAERVALVKEIVESALATGLPTTFEAAAEHIFPKVIADARLCIDRLYMKSMGQTPFEVPCWPLTDDLVLILAYDTGPSIIDLEYSAFERWEVEVDDVLERAFENLQQKSEGAFDVVAPGVYASPWKDCYDVARLCLPGLFLDLDLRGDPVAMVPNRNSLLVAGSDDPEGLARLASLGEMLMGEDRMVHGGAIRLADGEWAPFEPDDLANEFRTLRRASDAAYYEDQAKLLDKINAASGDQVFIAPFRVASDKESGMTFSYTVWQAAVPAMLPKCDLIALYGDANEDDSLVLMAEWERVVQLAGDLMEPTGLAPPRYRVDAFPDADIMDQLREQSVALT